MSPSQRERVKGRDEGEIDTQEEPSCMVTMTTQLDDRKGNPVNSGDLLLMGGGLFAASPNSLAN